MDSYNTLFDEIFQKIEFEKIKDHPNILIAARFWEEDRYQAAKVCFKFMRKIDDLIDNHKSDHKFISPGDKGLFMANVNHWIRLFSGKGLLNEDQKELKDTFRKFHIPLWPMEAFAKAMIYDINNDGFASLDSFLEYAQGASVAPAAIFVHLAGLNGENGKYSPPSFDVKEAAIACAIFSYLVHIIRDFQKDQLNNLHYFADDMLAKHGLDRNIIRSIAHGEPVSENFRALIKDYKSLAELYKNKTYESIVKISPLMEPRNQLSLHLIFNLYLMVFERINITEGSFTSEELNPTAEEIRLKVKEVIMNFEPVCSGSEPLKLA
jgi:phytoene/squalene synthetase